MGWFWNANYRNDTAMLRGGTDGTSDFWREWFRDQAIRVDGNGSSRSGPLSLPRCIQGEAVFVFEKGQARKKRSVVELNYWANAIFNRLFVSFLHDPSSVFFDMRTTTEL